MLETIEQQHADERAFQLDLTEWQTSTAEPELHPNWSQFYANALRDALRKANMRRKEILAAMTQNDWIFAVHREMQADLWYQAPHQEDANIDSVIELAEPSNMRNGNGNSPKVSTAAG